MEFKDFKIGEYFCTATGRWKCTDIGTKVIIAQKDGSDVEDVFDKYDFGGCSLTKFELSEKHGEVFQRLRTNEALEEDLILANKRIVNLEKIIADAISAFEESEAPFYKGIKILKQ